MLLKSAKNVEHAKVICVAISTGLKQAFNSRMKDMKVKDLKLDTMLDTSAEQYETYSELLKMFEEDDMLAALDVINGMPDAIDSFIREENSKRPLSELKATFL